MDATGVLPPHFNLTGQVSIQGYMPDFTGNYSCVWRGVVHGNLVAVKIIKATGEPASMQRKVIRERAIWGSMNHPNIHPLYGFADDPPFEPFGALISPWCAKGDSRRFLHENGERMILAERMALWEGVIEGVIYLHDQVPPIVHGDLKPGNVLIDDFGVPKICDFGLARIFLEHGSTGMTTTSEHTGTTRYLAPELVASNATVYPTLASDVYALGCLGLDFIYLQQPFSNHPNNLRGQIFRDLRRGLPPATERPHQPWPSNRIWPAIANCWVPNPWSRPSAFATSHMLCRTPFTFPTVVIKRIAHFVDIKEHGTSGFWDIWNYRCQSLRHLCLVSRTYRECATPFLYRQILLDLENRPQSLSKLILELQSSNTKAPLFPRGPGGYGACTEKLFLAISESTFFRRDLSIGIRNLMRKLPGLRLTYIQPYGDFYFPTELSSLTTLAIQRVDITLLFDHIPTLQALASVQRLSMEKCEDSGFLRLLALPETFPTVYLPNLLAISFDGSNTSILKMISNWSMPGLRFLYFIDPRDPHCPLTDFFSLLGTHGSQLQHLSLTSRQFRERDISDILNLCSGLRSIETKVIQRSDSLLTFSTPHARLEKIYYDPGLYMDDLTNRRIAAALFDLLKGLRLRAQSCFPKLREAEFAVTGLVRGVYRRAYVVSFCTGEKFIALSDGHRRHRLYDGQPILVEYPYDGGQE